MTILRRWCIVAVVCTAVGSTVPLLAQPLDSLVRMVVQRHPGVESARTAVRMAEARARSAAAWEPPRVGVEFSMLPPSEPNPFARGETMIMIEQMIPLFGQNRAMARAMSAESAVGEAALVAVQRELRAVVEREYYTLWLLARRDELTAENRRLAQALYSAVETQYEVGRAAQSDVLAAAVELGRLDTDILVIAQEQRASLARLNALLGRAPETPVAVPDSLAPDALPPVEQLRQRIAAHPNLKRMEAMAAMNRAGAEAQEAMLAPMLMVRGGVSYMPDGHPVREGNLTAHGVAGMDDGVMRFGLTAGAMISLPIVPWARSGPGEQATVYRLEAQQALQDREAMALEMETMLYDAYAQAQRAALWLEYYTTTQLPLLERTLEALRNDYTTGRVPFASVLNGYSMLVMARMDVAMKHMEYAMTLSMITQITGEQP